MNKKTNIILALLAVSCSFLTAASSYYARFHPRNWGRSPALREFFITTKIETKEITDFLESRKKPSNFSIQMDGRTFNLYLVGEILLDQQTLKEPIEFISDDRKYAFEGKEYVDSSVYLKFTSPVTEEEVSGLIDRLKTELNSPPEISVTITYSHEIPVNAEGSQTRLSKTKLLGIKMRRIIHTTKSHYSQPLGAYQFASGRVSYSAPTSTDPTPAALD